MLQKQYDLFTKTANYVVEQKEDEKIRLLDEKKAAKSALNAHRNNLKRFLNLHCEKTYSKLNEAKANLKIHINQLKKQKNNLNGLKKELARKEISLMLKNHISIRDKIMQCQELVRKEGVVPQVHYQVPEVWEGLECTGLAEEDLQTQEVPVEDKEIWSTYIGDLQNMPSDYGALPNPATNITLSKV